MNEHNNHRIIEIFAKDKNVKMSDKISIIKEASNFTDDFRGILYTEAGKNPSAYVRQLARTVINDVSAIDSPIPNSFEVRDAIVDTLESGKETANVISEFINQYKYYFFHFYYDIDLPNNEQADSGTIILKRSGKDQIEGKGRNIIHTLKKCSKDNVGIKDVRSYDRKEFFTFVNSREDSLKSGIAEGTNQSDSVAFLHAMGAEKGEQSTQQEFERHLEKCFAEYLFLNKSNEDIFMLGIALHGIMDSFTPSHTMFQKYTEQNMALHAQGDVIPIEDEKEKFEFDPGLVA